MKMSKWMMGSIVAGSIVLAAAGCASNSRSSSGTAADARVGLTLEPSTRTLIVGETVTIFARTQDTYGRSSKVNWTSSSGTLTTEEGGRIARVRFNEPGTFTVVAVLLLDGTETRRETVQIAVKPLT